MTDESFSTEDRWTVATVLDVLSIATFVTLDTQFGDVVLLSTLSILVVTEEGLTDLALFDDEY